MNQLAQPPDRLSVDDDEFYENQDVPAVFLRTDPAGVRRAVHELVQLQRHAGELCSELGVIERALRFTEQASPPAAQARRQVRAALAGLEHGVMTSLGQAAQALGTPGTPGDGHPG